MSLFGEQMIQSEKLTKEIRVRVEPALYETLVALAKEKHLKTSTNCRAMLKDFLKKELPPNHSFRQPKNFLEMIEA